MTGGYLAFPCTERGKLLPLYFMMNGYWYEMSVDDFVFDASANQDMTLCALSVVANQQDFFLFGNSFLRGYYSIHDMKDGYLGIAPHATSTKSFVFMGALPGTKLTGIRTQNVWTWVITAIIFLGWGLLVSLWMHPYFVNDLKIAEGWAVSIESAGTIGLGLLFSLCLVPELNKAFADAPDITAIDPS